LIIVLPYYCVAAPDRNLFQTVVHHLRNNTGTPAALAGQQFQCRRAQIERLDLYHEYSSFDRYPTAANTVHECLTDLLDWVRGGIMGERKPWWPKLKSLPFFTSSAEWEAQLSAEDRIEVEDDEDEKKEENAVGVCADPAIKKSDKQ
jgi:hypothetical protein